MFTSVKAFCPEVDFGVVVDKGAWSLVRDLIATWLKERSLNLTRVKQALRPRRY